jgi:ribose transport system permease protein
MARPKSDSASLGGVTKSRGERSGRAKLRRALSFRTISAVYVFIALFILYSLWVPSSFLTTSTLTSLLSEQAIVGIAAVGLVVPLAAGVFDLSIGASVGIGSILVAWLMSNQGVPVVPAMVLAILAGVAIGLANSFLVTKVGIDSFIATLGMSSILLAAGEWITKSQVIVGLPNSFLNIATSKLFGITLPVYYLLVIAIVLWYVLEHTPMGRYVYATGGNPESARLSGVPTTKVIMGSLVLAATVAAFAGILLSSQIASAADTAGSSYLLPTFAAVFLGSTQIKNGQYNIWGTVIAVYVLATGVKGLLLAGAPLWLPDLFNGVVLLIAVGLSVRRRRARVQAAEHTVEEEAEAPKPPALAVNP